jgi:hypothetical protein
MGLPLKILLSIATLVFIAVAGICGWLFVYTKDLPKTELTHTGLLVEGVDRQDATEPLNSFPMKCQMLPWWW